MPAIYSDPSPSNTESNCEGWETFVRKAPDSTVTRGTVMPYSRTVVWSNSGFTVSPLMFVGRDRVICVRKRR